VGQRGRPSLHSEEFRRDAVALVRSSDRTIAQVAEDLGVNRETLRSWVRAAEKHDALASAGVGQAELEELRRLRKENAELKVEKEILRKAAQYFAREMGR
jgi:transposase